MDGTGAGPVTVTAGTEAGTEATRDTEAGTEMPLKGTAATRDTDVTSKVI